MLGMQTTGTPTLVTGGSNDSFLGSGGIGALLIGALLFGGGLGGWGNRAGAVGADAVQTQLGAIQGSLNTNNVISEINDLSCSVNNGFNTALLGIKDNANLYLQGNGQLSTQIANGNFTNLSSLNGAVNTITNQNYQNALSSLNSFNQQNTTMLQGFNEIGRDAANYNNLILSNLQAQNMQAAACLDNTENELQ